MPYGHWNAREGRIGCDLHERVKVTGGVAVDVQHTRTHEFDQDLCRPTPGDVHKSGEVGYTRASMALEVGKETPLSIADTQRHRGRCGILTGKYACHFAAGSY